MSTLPDLCSGALVQVPLRREEQSATKRVEYWGGGVQLLTTRRRAGAAWLLRYTGLTERETARLLQFCEARAEDGGFVEFTDPISGTVYTKCEIDFSSLQIMSERSPGYEVRFRLRSASE